MIRTPRAAILIATSLFLAGSASAQSMLGNDGSVVDETVSTRFPLGGVALGICSTGGLEETVHTDPDWVIVASDVPVNDLPACLWTTEQACNLVYPYMNIADAPCWEFLNQYSKLPAGVSSSGIVSGLDPVFSPYFNSSYDSLFVREGVTVQVYAPADYGDPDARDCVPFGSPVTGPAMITPGYSSPTCHPYSPADLTLPDLMPVAQGEPIFGQMVYWPIAVEPVSVLEVITDTYEEQNAQTNHTEGFVAAGNDRFIVRRASTFDVQVRMNEAYPDALPIPADCTDLLLIATDPSDETEYQIPRVDDIELEESWAFEVVSIDVDPVDQTRLVTCRIQVASDARIGEYEFRPILGAKDFDD